MHTPTRYPSRRRRYRHFLALTTAVGGLMVAIPATGQSLPTPTLPKASDATVPSGAGSATINQSGRNLSVNLNAKNTVINWDGFNVPVGATADFSDARNLGLGGLDKIAVLNRDVNKTGAVSQLLGTITSDRNVAVWVLNPNGILVGGGAKISTGALVLSTLGISDADFLDGNGNYALSADARASPRLRSTAAPRSRSGSVRARCAIIRTAGWSSSRRRSSPTARSTPTHPVRRRTSRS